MKGDFSRWTFDPDRQYTSVLRQQGRVDLDADWNESEAIQAHLRERALTDLIGGSGTPGNGFALTVLDEGVDLEIAAGRFYVEGVLVENPADVLYQGSGAAGETIQPNGALEAERLESPNPETPELPPLEVGNPPEAARLRTDLVYLETWQRHVTALEDPGLREVALGGPDTTTRLQTTWRVRVVRGADTGDCTEDIQDYPPEPTTGRLTTADHPSTEPGNPCAVEPERGGFRGRENRLYRVEIHHPGSEVEATFVWSAENAAVVYAAASVDDAHRLTLRRPAPDAVLAIRQGDTVEVRTAADESQDSPGLLATVDGPPRGLQLVLTADLGALVGRGDVTVRRWDAPAAPVGSGGPLGLSGIRADFSAGTYRSGDYWLVPARVRDASYERLADAAPHGSVRRHARLGLLHWWRQGGSVLATVQDCRRVFPGAAELATLHYVGGDGQETLPGEELGAPLQVRVNRGGQPVPGAAVVFEATTGTLGDGTERMVLATEDDGTAATGWTPAPGVDVQQATASLRDQPWLRVVFTATLSTADRVAYTPADGCDLDAGTVQQALDQLCARGGEKDPGIRVTGVFWGTGAGRMVGGVPAGELEVDTDGERVLGLRRRDGMLGAEALAALQGLAAERDMPYLVSAQLHDGKVVLGGTRRGAARVRSELEDLLAELRADLDGPVENDGQVQLEVFAQGLRIVCTEELDPAVSRAACYLSIDMPLPQQPGIGGYVPVVLRPDDEFPAVRGNQLLWRPDSGSVNRVAVALSAADSFNEAIVLTRLMLKGNHIRDASGRLYLDGEAFGQPNTPPHNLVPTSEDGPVPTYSGNDRRGGDFEMWFWVGKDMRPPRDRIGFVVVRRNDWHRFNPLLSLRIDRQRIAGDGLLPPDYVVRTDITFDPDAVDAQMQQLGLELLPFAQDPGPGISPEILVPRSLGQLYASGVARNWEPLLRGRVQPRFVPDETFVDTAADSPHVMLFCRHSDVVALASRRGADYDPGTFEVL